MLPQELERYDDVVATYAKFEKFHSDDEFKKFRKMIIFLCHCVGPMYIFLGDYYYYKSKTKLNKPLTIEWFKDPSEDFKSYRTWCYEKVYDEIHYKKIQEELKRIDYENLGYGSKKRD
jgi:hypothetical protein